MVVMGVVGLLVLAVAAWCVRRVRMSREMRALNDVTTTHQDWTTRHDFSSEQLWAAASPSVRTGAASKGTRAVRAVSRGRTADLKDERLGRARAARGMKDVATVEVTLVEGLESPDSERV